MMFILWTMVPFRDDETGSDLGRGYLVIYNTYKKGASSIGNEYIYN